MLYIVAEQNATNLLCPSFCGSGFHGNLTWSSNQSQKAAVSGHLVIWMLVLGRICFKTHSICWQFFFSVVIGLRTQLLLSSGVFFQLLEAISATETVYNFQKPPQFLAMWISSNTPAYFIKPSRRVSRASLLVRWRSSISHVITGVTFVTFAIFCCLESSPAYTLERGLHRGM